MNTGEIVYLSALTLIISMVAVIAVIDFALYVHGDQTISQWLRVNPAWFWTPLALAGVLAAVLIIHLFLWF